MSKEKNNDKEKGSKIVLIASILIFLFLLLSILTVVVTKRYDLVKGLVGIIALLVTMNSANIIRISKEKVKLFSIFSVALSAIALVLLILIAKPIYSLALAVPALILSTKCMKKDSRQLITKVALAFSAVAVLGCFAITIINLVQIKNYNNLLKK